ncbi:ChaN family lipoprotein [Aquabacterium sp.]|uniref:ChaN family lipoprotein n=1 Tax=Aquabacterium sp. TaxID=1872578 RepID=UPI002BA09F98|nr:ChaN family lipoprotein [Aquabacterium sp.]HSW05077.1 ChaN family lipoprotein [Aquabacterium sp.]
MTGDAIVLLGEVHDNAAQHQLRLDLLKKAFAAGWRPAIAMEQFDIERQADIERARRERPREAQHVIDLATAPAGAARSGGGWNWAFYRPYVALALDYDVPLLAANLSNADTRRIVREGLAARFDAGRLTALGLDRAIASDWQQAQEREIDRGHCGALPSTLWPRMAQAQFARDAVMAELLRQHARQGIVLLAGNGHVRRDVGVPRWLRSETSRLFVVGLLERDDVHTPADAFDATLRTEPAERPDPCAQFKPRAIGSLQVLAAPLGGLGAGRPPR